MALGAFGLHPLDQIVNVKWGGIKLILACMFTRAEPQWFINFSPGKPADKNTVGETEDGKTYAAPKFGSTTSLLTETQSINQQIGSPPAPTIIITGNALQVSVPGLRRMDWRGYTTMQLGRLQLVPGNPPPSPTGFFYINVVDGPLLYFDPDGKPVDEIPTKEETKGTAIASDDQGTWYMSADKGFRKFDENDSLIVPNPSGDTIPLTVAYNGETKLIKAVFGHSPHASSTQAEIAFYDLAGELQDKIIVGDDNFDGQEVSKKGKIYGFEFQGGERIPDSPALANPIVNSIIGYDSNGKKLFTIDPIGGTDFTANGGTPRTFTFITAYGEDYIVAGTFLRDFSSIDHGLVHDPTTGGDVRVVELINTRNYGYVVYDASNGNKISETDFGTFEEHRTDVLLGGITTSTQDISSYNELNFVIRNAYFPFVTPLQTTPPPP